MEAEGEEERSGEEKERWENSENITFTKGVREKRKLVNKHQWSLFFSSPQATFFLPLGAANYLSTYIFISTSSGMELRALP